MNVLSLSGGIETGLIAFKELGVKIDNYYSSEIDKYASSVASFNHPEIKELGTVVDYAKWDLPKIDLILAGPPCQGFSIAGKGLNWNDPRSQLFFTAIEILWKYNPKYFLFENVASMKKEIVKEIDELMEVDSVKINSALVSAQNRKRNYWFNWSVEQPDDKGILLKDVIECGAVDRYKSHCLDANYWKGGNLKSYFEKGRRQLVFTDKLQTIPSTIYKENAKSMVKRGKKGLLVYDGVKFRKLTPVECERLQTLPDGTTEKGINEKGELAKISNTQRYKMIGNGWTKDVIKWILSGVK